MEQRTDLWWLLFIRGLALVLLGVAAIFWPGPTLAFLFFVLAAYLIVDGVVEIVTGVSGIRTLNYWWLTITKGVLQVVIGGALLRSPALGLAISLIALVVVLGVSFIIKGIIEIAAAAAEKYDQTSRTLLLVAGVLAVVAGVILLFNPLIGTLLLTILLGFYALVAGAMTLSASLSLRSHMP